MMIFRWLDTAFRRVQLLDFLPLLAIRIYLLPIFYEGAHAKLTGFSALVQWFGAPAAQGGLNMPAPLLMATLATATETAGCICLALGLFTRLISIPLMVTMTVAGLSVHWSHGWAAIAGKTAESTLRFQAFMEWLAQNFPGRFNYITKLGDPIILNNGIEFTVTYVIMLAVLLFYGAGRFLSLDYWIARGRPLLFGWLLPAYHDAALVRPTGSPPMPQPTGYPAPAI
ncbi:DoxX family protein [Sphingomonas sp. MA1305]|jgi:putative oxidoreductase|uniref:DoxX family protein n=1 Tax=Novosphingobium pituita TaxID=3056842 RepID=A0ABQ6PDS8_9SPHN|nr:MULTISPECIES: DoxX family protein [Sphingomonadaceae]MBI0477381.1 DoxX family protein [Sphingomonas sp. MA1305]GMM62471.1 DoxX family protein [Novosphingobium sp. IK01]